jgi:hypothetical protein
MSDPELTALILSFEEEYGRFPDIGEIMMIVEAAASVRLSHMDDERD